VGVAGVVVLGAMAVMGGTFAAPPPGGAAALVDRPSPVALVATGPVRQAPASAGAAATSSRPAATSSRPAATRAATTAAPAGTAAAGSRPAPAAGGRAAPRVGSTAGLAPSFAPVPLPQVLPIEPLHGCPVPDPSGSGGCITPAMGVLMAQIIRSFGDLPASCWDPRDGDPYSDHPKGRACDYTMGRIGSYPGPAVVQQGWLLADWLRANAAVLHVNYVIWQGRIWSRAYDRQGWRPYTGGGHYAYTGPTNGHYDHVHVSTID